MYGKHFESMYTGSMRGAGPVAFAVWGWIISHQKPNTRREEFTVELDPELLAFVIGKVNAEDIARQIQTFCQPDLKSRTEAEEGRKLVKLGVYLYRVVNGAMYDRLRREDERREYNRERQRELRAKQKQPDQRQDAGQSAWATEPAENGALTTPERISIDKAITRGEEKLRRMREETYPGDPNKPEIKKLAGQVSEMKTKIGVPV